MNDAEELIGRMLAGELSDDETQALHDLLARDPAARQRYVEQCQLHAQLLSNPEINALLQAEELIDAPAASPDPGVQKSGVAGWRWRTILGSAAVSAVVVFGALQWSVSRTEKAVVVSGPPAGISPETAYQQAEFSESGSLKRPPTHFAVVNPGTKPGAEVSFNRDVRPIFSENCYQCHGPDANSRKAELRLDVEASAFAPHGKFAAPIVPGNPEQSPLYQRITSTLKSEIMPPLDSHKSLTAVEKGIIRDWIAQGAKWEGHWAFVKPRKMEPVPSEWGRGPIDAFVAAKHRELGLTPNVTADRATLARRLALDLTGLPPKPENVAAFVADERPDAYEQYVDSLLASPAYGEHQARFWLDAARYADTHGLHLDNYREIWPYRDWVVQAFNRNQPFDEFTVEQIAGDLLPNPTQSQMLATGFSRCSPTTSEGGAIDDEYRAIYAKDRAETAATVYLGLTVGCAACHDHKFDPISQKDFYQFSAFFNNIDGPIMDGNAYDTRPNLVMPRPEHEADWPMVQTAREQAVKTLNKLKNDRAEFYEAWLSGAAPEADVTHTLAGAMWARQTAERVTPDESTNPSEAMAEAPDWNFDQAFTVQVDYRVPTLTAGEERVVASKFDGDRGWRLVVMSGDEALPTWYRIRFDLVHSLQTNNLISVTSQSRMYNSPQGGKEISLVAAYDGSGAAAGVVLGYPRRVFIDGNRVVDRLNGSIANEAEVRLSTALQNRTAAGDEDDAPRTVRRAALYPAFEPLSRFASLDAATQVKAALAKPAESRNKGDINKLKDYYWELIDPVYREQKQALARVEARYQYIYDQATISLVMKEREEAAMAHILDRGEYDKKGEEVPADVPAVLGGLPADAPRDRLGLARWLVAEDNPLTARVAVNRIWQSLFGIGLVETAEDFGIMGDNPSHPELLDWLAVEFQESGWNVKALIKQIVRTETYRQEARIDAAEYAIDPDNRFLARGSRYRLDAEVIRDQALFVSGALNEQVGGPPVKPYQPVGIWNAVAYSGSNTRYYTEDTGAALYRRSLYTFWKRTAPPPNMTTFDAPSRETCSVRRDRTNTPLQALILMNDPQFVEAARLLAQRALAAPDLSIDGQISAMYRYAFGTAAPELHRKILAESYRRFEMEFRNNPTEAAKLVEVGATPSLDQEDVPGYASLTMVASQIMNLDSFINKY
jgi:hypothetical protein